MCRNDRGKDFQGFEGDDPSGSESDSLVFSDTDAHNEDVLEEYNDSSSFNSEDSSDENEEEASSHNEQTGEEAAEEDDEEEDPLVKAIRSEKEKQRNHPPDIKLDEFITDISFHPSESLIAIADVVGDVALYRYNNESTEMLYSNELHNKSCRDIEFSSDGRIIYSVSKDKSIVLSDSETGKMKQFYEKAHEDPLQCLYLINENLFSTGDDNGTVKVWDARQENPIHSFRETDDYVSDMICTNAEHYLVCSSGEGTLNALNLRSMKIFSQSEPYDTEFNCMGLLRRDTKLVVGASDGDLYVFNWAEFGLHSDEFPGLKNGINKMISITESIIIVGCDEGVLTAVSIFPHQILGVVGQHEFPIEGMDISGDGTYIASASHDQTVKFWNIKYFEEMHIKQSEKLNRLKGFRNNLPSSKYQNATDFFSGLL